MLRVGFIGTGGISRAHLSYLKTRDDVEVTALCDINSARLGKKVSEYGGTSYTDYKKILDTENLDAVWLCTDPKVREMPLLACAEKGLPVFCEKPAEVDEHKAAKIAGELAKYKAHVQIGYVFRSTPAIQELQKALSGDNIHLLQSFYACNVSLTMKLPEWFYLIEESGGALVDQATHNFDLLRYLFGEVKEISAMARNPVHQKAEKYTIDEVIGLIFTFSNGVIGSHMHTWVGDSWRNELVISGENQFYRLNLNNGILDVKRNPQTLNIDTGKSLGENEFKDIHFEQEKGSLFKYENAIFLQQVKSGDWSKNPSSYADAVKTLKLTLACNRAIESGRAVV